MTTPTLSDLLTTPTQSEVMELEILPELRARAVRVTDWGLRSVYRAMAFAVAKMRENSRTLIAALAAGGFEDYAFGFVAAPGGLDLSAWAPVLARQRYGREQIAATYTRRRITLTNSSATVYAGVAAGRIILLFPSGNRYLLDETVTIPGNGSVQAIFRSEFTNDSAAGRDYNGDPSGATIVLVTSSFVGVAATNPATTFSAVSRVGSGGGTITPSGAPGAPHTVAVRIDTSGQVGVATWSTALDGGAWVARGTATSATNIGGSGITATLANDGSGATPSFVAGDMYYFAAPGSDVTEVGRDAETPQELGARCRGLWPALAFQRDGAGTAVPASPTAAAYELLARTASDQVKTVLVTTGSVNNEVRIVVAGQGALLPAITLAAVGAFLRAYAMLTDYPVVLAPAPRAITLAGLTVTCAAGMVATAQAETQRRLQRYLGGGDLAAPLTPNGRIDHAYIGSLVRTAPGVKKITDTGLTINGTAGDLQLPVAPGALELATWTQQVASAFAWVVG